MTDNDALVRRTWAEISNAADSPTGKDDEDAFLVGLRDGFEDAVQLIDLLTGGDGEYRYCSDHDPDRHCPSPVEMIHRILAALRSTPQAKPLDLPAQDEVEVVARSISAAHGDCFDSAFNNKREWAANRGEKGGRFRDINEPMQSDYLDMATAAIAALDRHRGTDALREENARLRAVVDALAVLMPIQVHDGRDYAEVFFADGATHSTQAMTMNPQHWRDLTDAYDRAALTGGQG